MLVLTRKRGDAIVIGDGIVIQVHKITPSRVTLGIDAPEDLNISRRDARGRPESLDQLEETHGET